MEILQNASAAAGLGSGLFDAIQYVTNPYALLAFLFLVVIVVLGWAPDVSRGLRGAALTVSALVIIVAVVFLLRNSMANVAEQSLFRLANDGNRSLEVSPGVEVELIDVASLEGRLRTGRRVSGHAWNLTLPPCLPQRVFERAAVPPIAPERYRVMTQTDWEDYLAGLGELKADTVRDIPFARLAIVADGRRIEGVCGGWWLKGDVVEIPRKGGEPIRLRIANIYNTKNQTSGEPEAVNIELLD